MGLDVDDFIAETITGPVAEILIDALYCDGGHHKQWYIEQAIQALGYELPEEENVFDDPEFCSWERGIAP